MSWRRLRTLMRREVLATFRDPFTVAILITVPIAALLVFGFVLSTAVKHLALGVLDANTKSVANSATKTGVGRALITDGLPRRGLYRLSGSRSTRPSSPITRTRRFVPAATTARRVA